MYRIGEFARLSQTPVKTLRYYDEMGLLRPARTSDASGYRYYAAAQIEQLNRILVLKDLGFSLREIREIVADGAGLEDIRVRLRAKHDELEHRVDRERARLARAAARLELIGQAGHAVAPDVAVRGVGRQLVASVRATLRDHDESARLFDELERATGRGGTRGAVFHACAEGAVDCEAFVFLPARIDGCDRVRVQEWPAQRVTSLVYRGDDTYVPAYRAVHAWLRLTGTAVTGPKREIYLAGGDGEAESVTEIQFPIAGDPAIIH
jgi:DNA-binding transcriptional MerR regulator